ncbi:MAG: hypothetical protein GX639_06945 [Fibrobacter sp.]|nr:hypothetical protein [Fibrobacter sp.]
MDSREKLLARYASHDMDSYGKRDYFTLIVVVSLLLFGCGGYYLHRNVPPVKTLEEKITQITTSFIIQEKPKEVVRVVKEKKKEEVAPPKPAEVPKEPVDLTQNPVLAQKQNDVVEQPPQTEQPKVVRRVYGLKRVYSTGLGSGGSASDAVIGKLGNTLNVPIDTFTVTKEELKGQLVSVTTITSTPKIRNVVKPEYTTEMTENRVEGVVKVRVLVDIDGKVKKAIVLNDLGYGTKESVYNACLQLEFEPATINGTPCAVWIIIPFTFRMLN